MKKLATIVVFFALAHSAQGQTPPTPEAQALAQKLMGEINANIQCTAAGISMQQQLVAAQAKIKELEAKLPKPEEKK